MAISQVSPNSGLGTKATYPIPGLKPYLTETRTEIPVSKPFTVKLSGAALARSLKLQGYSVAMICIKMGLDATAIKQYLGQVEMQTPAIYVQPKQSYTESKSLSQARDRLTQDLNQVNFERFAWSSMIRDLLKPDQAV